MLYLWGKPFYGLSNLGKFLDKKRGNMGKIGEFLGDVSRSFLYESLYLRGVEGHARLGSIPIARSRFINKNKVL